MKQIIFDVYKNAVEIRKISSHYAVVERRKKNCENMADV